MKIELPFEQLAQAHEYIAQAKKNSSNTSIAPAVFETYSYYHPHGARRRCDGIRARAISLAEKSTRNGPFSIRPSGSPQRFPCVL